MAFCVCASLSLFHLEKMHIFSYIEYLIIQGVSAHMLANHISACKAKFTMYGLQFHLWEHPNVRYLLKSVKINRSIVFVKKHIIDLAMLNDIINQCDTLYLGVVFKAVFLLAFFGFLRLSNIAPHSLTSFDSSRHLCAGDLIFTKKILKVILKWSKTIQLRDRVHPITLPRVRGSKLCPFSACTQAMALYSPDSNDPLFQYKINSAWVVLTDTRIRKCLSKINAKMGLPKNYFTFHAFRRSGATLAYKSQVSVQRIKDHVTYIRTMLMVKILPLLLPSYCR